MRRIMNRRDNFNAIQEIKRLLDETKKYTFESFVMPEEDEYYGDDDDVLKQRETEMPQENGIANIEKELIEIRKIALNVINRLADQTSSESYDTMKRIWSLVDKAIESKNDEDKQTNNMRRMR